MAKNPQKHLEILHVLMPNTGYGHYRLSTSYTQGTPIGFNSNMYAYIVEAPCSLPKRHTLQER